MKFSVKKADAEAPTKRQDNNSTGKKKSQEDIILAHLQRFESGITSMEAFSKYHITRLSARIFNLRHRGHVILTMRETDKNGNAYARYILKEVDADERV